MDNLTNIIHPLISKFIGMGYDKIYNFSEMKENGITHIIFPKIFIENIELYKKIFDEENVNYSIYYSLKANKEPSLAEAALNHEIGIEVSSYYELLFAKKLGFRGENIICSGTLKNSSYVKLAIEMEAIIATDNENEILKILDYGKVCKVILRINPLNSESKFGIKCSKTSWYYEMIFKHNDILRFLGFSFHIPGYSIEERVECLEAIFRECNKIKKWGLKAEMIDIGGGIPINYLTEDSWITLNKISGDQFFTGHAIKQYYPYYQKYAKGEFVKQILNCKCFNSTIANILRELNIKLVIEPGRSLLDQAGISIFKVNGRKLIAHNRYLVSVDGNINHISESWFDSEFAVMPYLVCQKYESENFEAAICGNTCLEKDILTKRYINFEYKIREDDLIIYINTAGYQMDSNESEFHMYPIPQKKIYFE